MPPDPSRHGDRLPCDHTSSGDSPTYVYRARQSALPIQPSSSKAFRNLLIFSDRVYSPLFHVSRPAGGRVLSLPRPWARSNTGRAPTLAPRLSTLSLSLPLPVPLVILTLSILPLIKFTHIYPISFLLPPIRTLVFMLTRLLRP